MKYVIRILVLCFLFSVITQSQNINDALNLSKEDDLVFEPNFSGSGEAPSEEER